MPASGRGDLGSRALIQQPRQPSPASGPGRRAPPLRRLPQIKTAAAQLMSRSWTQAIKNLTDIREILLRSMHHPVGGRSIRDPRYQPVCLNAGSHENYPNQDRAFWSSPRLVNPRDFAFGEQPSDRSPRDIQGFARSSEVRNAFSSLGYASLDFGVTTVLRCGAHTCPRPTHLRNRRISVRFPSSGFSLAGRLTPDLAACP